MAYYDVRNAKITILDMLKYDAIQMKMGLLLRIWGNMYRCLFP